MHSNHPGAATCWSRLLLFGFVAIAINPAVASGQSQASQDSQVSQDGRLSALPSFAELEAAGAVIGEIRINVQDIFDLEDPKENTLLYRTVNKLHMNTHPGVIKRSLLFKSGEPVSARLIEETERLLHDNRFLYSAFIRPIAYHDGVVDIEVKTRDTWSLEPGVKYSRAGGTNTTGITFDERNLLGTGVSLGLKNISDVDRSGSELEVNSNHAFGGWYNANYKFARLSDGKRQSFSLAQPFYALDIRSSYGVSVSTDDRIDSIYNSGVKAGQYPHSQTTYEVFGGWSDGLIDNRARRFTIGISYEINTYGLATELTMPIQPPSDLKVAAPFIRYEVIEDSFQKLENRDQIGRSEYVAMGFQSSVQIANSVERHSNADDLWIYSGSMSNGFRLSSNNDLLVAASLSGKYSNHTGEKHLLSGSAKYYMPQSEHTLLFVSIEGNAVKNPDIDEYLEIGGDSGLRGYPLRYQSGDRSALLTVERRAYSDWYPFRLFRVGGAVFYDVGRAWGGGVNQNISNPGWLNDVGFGLRILSARSAFGNVTHADFAFPLNRDANTRSFQFLLKTKTSF